MMTFDRTGLADRLSLLAQPRQAVFAAGCLERSRPCVNAFALRGREAETALLNRALDDLWRTQVISLSSDERDRIESYLETVEEENGDLRAAYLVDYLSAFFYVLDTSATQAQRLANCAHALRDAASYLDTQNSAGDPTFAADEIGMQEQHLAMLDNGALSVSVVSDAIREQSASAGQRILAATEAAFARRTQRA